MNKNQMTMAIIGGVALVAVLPFAYLAYSASADRAEKETELEGFKNTFNQNRRFSKAEADGIAANAQKLKDWSKEAYGEASSLAGADMSPEEFKAQASVFLQKMRSDVVGYQSGEKKILPEDTAKAYEVFADFKEYLNGKFPDNPDQVRQWGDICLFADTLAAARCTALESVKVEAVEKPEEPEDRSARRRSPAAKEKEENPIDARTYRIVFLARPAALVDALNGFAKAERFVAVDDLAFAQDPDPLPAMFESKKDGDKEETGGRRRRGRRRAAEQEPEQEEEDKALRGKVTDPNDPLVCTPFRVTMKISTLTVKPVKEEGK
ncbi:MAG: Amuc_1100 family pilus-like protein [Kiritimatiellae bacterium]|nr:Amuc_1100 family pilus-like protein [Kiritimatiellia bacterium]